MCVQAKWRLQHGAGARRVRGAGKRIAMNQRSGAVMRCEWSSRTHDEDWCHQALHTIMHAEQRHAWCLFAGHDNKTEMWLCCHKLLGASEGWEACFSRIVGLFCFFGPMSNFWCGENDDDIDLKESMTHSF